MASVAFKTGLRLPGSYRLQGADRVMPGSRISARHTDNRQPP